MSQRKDLFYVALLTIALAPGSLCKEPEEPQLGTVIELTDTNFDKYVLNGKPWMIDVFAPWCSHCRQLEPAWAALAAELKSEGVYVAKVDGTKQKALMSRLRVEHFPSIFYLREGRAWAYQGARSVPAFRDFALSGYKKATALPLSRTPNNAIGVFVGKLHSIPGTIKRAYNALREEGGWSDLGILCAVLAVPVMTGAITICAVDAFYVRRAHTDHYHDDHVRAPEPVAAPVVGEHEFEGDDGELDDGGHAHHE